MDRCERDGRGSCRATGVPGCAVGPVGSAGGAGVSVTVGEAVGVPVLVGVLVGVQVGVAVGVEVGVVVAEGVTVGVRVGTRVEVAVGDGRKKIVPSRWAVYSRNANPAISGTTSKRSTNRLIWI